METGRTMFTINDLVNLKNPQLSPEIFLLSPQLVNMKQVQ